MPGKLVFALDLGINNVGWCATRRTEKEVEILAAGTYVFESPLEDDAKPSEGLSSKKRGMLRRARRTINRRRQRKMAMYRLLSDHGFLPRKFEERVALLCRNKNERADDINPYALRAKALDKKLEPYELGRVISHLNQRRGYLDPRDLMLWGIATTDDAHSESQDDETGPIKEEIKRTKEAMQGFRTVGELFHDRLMKGLPVRKKKIPADLKKAEKDQAAERRFVRTDRHLIHDELRNVLEAQAAHHPILTQSLQKQILDLAFDQRKLSARKSTRGKCVFFPDELRTPRASLSGQRFTTAQEIAHLQIQPTPQSEFRFLTAEERRTLVGLLMQGDDLTWPQAKRAINQPAAIFGAEPVGKKQSGTKQALKGSKTVQNIKRLIGDKWDQMGEQAQRDLVSDLISIRDWFEEAKKKPQSAARRKAELFKTKSFGPTGVKFTDREAYELATIGLPDGYLNISLKAAKKLLPHLLKDKVYSEACTAVGIDHASPEGDLPTLDRLPFPSQNDIGHALVRTSVQSAVRVLNVLHEEYGKPDQIIVELTRDIAAGAEQREQIEKAQRQNANERKAIMAELVEVGLPPNPSNIKKVRLWRELGGQALAYEPDITIQDIRELITGDYEIDHIVPRSHSLDNSMGNLTLCTREFNTRIKGNKTPYEALASDDAQWKQISAHVKQIKSMSPRKRARILAKERPEDFTGRHLAATGYIGREVLRLVQRMVGHKPDAIVTPGQATAFLRSFWQIDDLVPLHPEEQEQKDQMIELERKFEADETLNKDELSKLEGYRNKKARSNFLHHTLDAITLAMVDRSTLKAITDFYQLMETNDAQFKDKESRKKAKASRLPDPDFRSKVEQALNNAHVVHRPSRKPKGELHKMMPLEKVVKDMPPGEPWGSEVRGKYLVRFGHDGTAVQAFPLGNNHHCIIWERTEPNKKGEYERFAEVVPTIEAVRRRSKGEPVIRKHHPDPGWKFVMALCKGDMVLMDDGTIGVVSKFNATQRPGDAQMAIWITTAAQQLGAVAAGNPYLIAYIQTRARLREIAARVVLDPLGNIVYREGGSL